jgi:hypothetical protein
MSEQGENALSALLIELTSLLEPIRELYDHPYALFKFFSLDGWYIESLLTSDLLKVIGELDSIQQSIEELETGSKNIDSFDEFINVLDSIANLLPKIKKLAEQVLSLSDLGINQNVVRIFAADLLNYLVLEYFYRHSPAFFQIVKLLTLIVGERPDILFAKESDPGTVLRYPVLRPTLKLQNLTNLFSDPIDHLKNVYLPTNGTLATSKDAQELTQTLFISLRNLVLLLGGRAIAGLEDAPESELNNPENITLCRTFSFVFQFLKALDDETSAVTQVAKSSFGASLTVIPADSIDSSGHSGPGLEITPFGLTTLQANLGTWKLNITGDAGTKSFIIAPKRFSYPNSDSATVGIQISLSKGGGTEAAFILGANSGTHLKIGQLCLVSNFNLSSVAQDYGLRVDANTGAIVIAAGDGDGFLQKVLPRQPISLDFDLGLGWSNRLGVYIRGGAGFEVIQLIHKSLFDILKIETIYLALRAKDESISLTVAASAGLKLGPLAASVDRIGLLGKITFPKEGGNLGIANFELGFKPPDGAGMAIDASVVVGGGYLFFDRENEQYAGILQLEIKKRIALKAIGLLTTRMPDGSKGFSLLIIITAEFPPIQLSYGFTLNGVGGLIGINRTMMLDALRTGIKAHALDSILFPKDPVARAPQIISDLRTIFPPAEGRYVFGPMVQIGWGASIVTANVGIILELPSPVRLAIMGQLRLLLPPGTKEEDAIVLLRMDVLGAIDFGRGDASIDATLYDSRIARFSISGDMAMRLNWGDKPLFALAIGGFNPRFPPPPGFPKLDRLAISLNTDATIRARLESYLALTSNTIQFGARLDFYAQRKFGAIGNFSVAAYFEFDTLIQFQPFWFQVDLNAGALLMRNGDPLFGVTLQATLTGPEPVHIWGEATFSFLGKHTLPFNWTSEDAEPPVSLEPSKVLADLHKQLTDTLADKRNWGTQFPNDGHALVTLRSREPGEALLLHPFGELEVRQRVVPLNLKIAMFNGIPLDEQHCYSLKFFDVTKTELKAIETKDPFAPGQYLSLTDDQKLTRPSFESFTSGYQQIRLGESISFPLDSDSNISTSFEYETARIDRFGEIPTTKENSQPYVMSNERLLEAAHFGATGESPMRRTGSAKYAGPVRKVVLKERTYTVASVDDLEMHDGKVTATTYTEAEIQRRRISVGDNRWQVVGIHEVRL